MCYTHEHVTNTNCEKGCGEKDRERGLEEKNEERDEEENDMEKEEKAEEVGHKWSTEGAVRELDYKKSGGKQEVTMT